MSRDALKAIQRLAEIRSRLQAAHDIFPGDPLSEVRAEWDEDIERLWRAEPRGSSWQAGVDWVHWIGSRS